MVGVHAMESADDEFSFHTPPDDIENENVNGENDGDPDENEDEDSVLDEPEMRVLNEQIDQLNSCLDRMERQNDVLKAELLELLESNRQTRQEMAEERERVEAVASLSIDQTSEKPR